MKERKCYEVPSITVISMDAHNDIIQTSTVSEPAQLNSLSNIATYGSTTTNAGVYNAKNLWNN